MNNQDLDYLFDKYKKSKGNVRAFKILQTALKADLIYNITSKSKKGEA